MRRRDVRQALESIGGSPAPRPRAGFVDQLASRLRVSHAAGDPDVPYLRQRRRPVALVATTAAAAALLLAVFLVQMPGRDGGAIVLVTASDAVVDLPDGRTVPAASGLEVPEGGVVRTGEQGSVVANGSRLGPEAEGVVREGKLVTTTATPTPASPDATPVASPRPSPASPTPVPTRPPTPAPTPTPDGRPVTEALRLECAGVSRDGGTGVYCKWSASRHPSFAGYMLWRDDGADRRVVFRAPDRDQTGFFDEPPAGRALAYLVEALDGGGSVVGSGGPVRVSSRDQVGPAVATARPVSERDATP